MDQKVLLSERSEFQHFPIFGDAQIMLKRSVSTPKGRVYGRLFWITFFGEAKKVIGCRATPDLKPMSLREK
jgi:hypothetical protein